MTDTEGEVELKWGCGQVPKVSALGRRTDKNLRKHQKAAGGGEEAQDLQGAWLLAPRKSICLAESLLGLSEIPMTASW